LGSLELSTAERVALDELRRVHADAAGPLAPFKKMGARARRLVESASGVGVVTTRETDALSDVSVGRVMHRAWLELTRRGMVAQPMSSIHAMTARRALDSACGGSEWIASASAATAAFRAAFPSVDRAERIAFVLRIGW